MATKLPTIVNGVDVSKELREGVDIMSNKKKYPFKESILGMIPEGVSIDESYMINIADSMDLDVSDIIKQWSSVFDSGWGSSKEALQKTIDERDETIDSLERKLRIVISDRDKYKEQLSSPSKEIDLLNSQLEKSKASYVDLRTKYDNLCKEKREYGSLAEEYNELLKNYNKIGKDIENAKDTICKLRDDLEEQNKYINYIKENCISREVAKEEMGYAEREIKQRIEDTKDLIRAIHTISKFI